MRRPYNFRLGDARAHFHLQQACLQGKENVALAHAALASLSSARLGTEESEGIVPTTEAVSEERRERGGGDEAGQGEEDQAGAPEAVSEVRGPRSELEVAVTACSWGGLRGGGRGRSEAEDRRGGESGGVVV